MEIGKIVEVNGKRYYLTDQTMQDNKRYILGTLVDEHDLPLIESDIFEEKALGDKYYLESVPKGDMFNFLSAIFVSNFNKMLGDEE